MAFWIISCYQEIYAQHISLDLQELIGHPHATKRFPTQSCSKKSTSSSFEERMDVNVREEINYPRKKFVSPSAS